MHCSLEQEEHYQYVAQNEHDQRNDPEVAEDTSPRYRVLEMEKLLKELLKRLQL